VRILSWDKCTYKGGNNKPDPQYNDDECGNSFEFLHEKYTSKKFFDNDTTHINFCKINLITEELCDEQECLGIP
jgi:hypothetical protein